MSAINNWWGTINKDEIAETIYDFHDNDELGEADFEPFLCASYPDGQSSPCLSTITPQPLP